MAQKQWNPFELLKRSSEQAEASAQNRAYGQLTVESHYFQFGGQGEAPTEIDAATYGKALEAKQRGVMQKVKFIVDPSAFAPSTAFLYERQVGVVGREKIRETGKYTKSDWETTVLPSIINAFGSMDKFIEAMSSNKAVWVCAEDTPQQADPKYNTIKFLQVFDDKAACAKAWAEKYGAASAPAFPADVVNTMLLYRKSFKTEEQIRGVIATNPELAQYDVEELLKIA